VKPTTVIAILAALALTACGPKTDSQNTAATAPAESKVAKGTGTVTAVDSAAGTVTLDHGPIAEIGWPAMTMAFKASPAVTAQAKVGDRVDFDLKMEGGAGEVTALRKQP
jgi:Cu(I)/Ag(I) efflux system periplasmic protein CusF